MVTRPIPISRQVRRPAPRPMPRPVHKAPPPQSNGSQFLVGGLIGAGVLIVLAVMYTFGDAGIVTGYRAQNAETVPPPATPVSRTTTYYRDLKNGRVMVMEIDEKGTRVLGTKAKEDVELANEALKDPNERAVNTVDRLNAFSQTFK